jgi:indolepyruvate ferredoxin oxidoreductase
MTTFTPSDIGAFSLDDKYTREDGAIYLTGVQALVRLPLDQHRADRRRGLRTATFISGYRGSPLGGYDMELSRAQKLLDRHHVVHQPGLNEELAATAVFGSQMAGFFPGAKYDGVLGVWYGKGPGVDRTGDAFKHANHAGVGRNGGVLALGGDDPSSKSSTLPSDSEVAFYDALMPTLYPGSVQEVLDLGLHGFALSRVSGLWVGFKVTTNVADGTGTAEVSPDRVRPFLPSVELDGRPFEHQMNLALIPPSNLEMERTLHYARLELARRYAWENDLNRITVPTSDAWLGIVAAGKTYYDLRQALDELGLDDEALRRHGIRLLQVGMLFPLEPRVMREFARGLQEILVVEEKRPFLETFARDALYSLPDRPAIVGKADEEARPLLPSYGELDSELISRAVAARLGRRLQVSSVEHRIRYLDGQKDRLIPLTLLDAPARTPYYCSGCPHNRSTVVPEGSIVGAGIGCHSMGLWMDPARFGPIIGITQMGGEGAQWVGISPFTETKHLFQNVGDGTLFHSGQMAINFAVAAGVNVTYKILYNSAVAMTGGQEAVGTLPVPALTRRLEVEGVKRTIVTTDEPDRYRRVQLASNAEVWHRDRIVEAQESLAATAGVTVLIHDQQCAAEKRRLRKRGRQAEPVQRLYINERVCEGCGDCGHKSNCLSVQPIDTEFGRKTAIHQASCNKDYSCLLGDCPSFVTVVPKPGAIAKNAADGPAAPLDLPEPKREVEAEGYSLHMMGIGGTGVVTVSQVLGTAALLDGLQVWGLDQTGLSQKGGPVVSDLRLSSNPLETSKVAAGGTDLYLGFDLLVAADPKNLAKADPVRTAAVVSTSRVPTGKMVVDTSSRFPALADLLAVVDGATRNERNVYLDAQAISEALFGSHMQANLVTLGAAYQRGFLPILSDSIEQAIRLNGAAVEENIAAFRWGRTVVVDPERVEAAVAGTVSSDTRKPAMASAARRMVESSDATGELRRLLEVRVPDLIAYQNRAYARGYLEVVRSVAAAERGRAPGRSDLGEAVARNLYKLMAYKDEYEVARLHLDAAAEAAIRAGFGDDVTLYWNLHPPLLRALGMKRKLKLGPWFTPAMKALRAAKALRGTPLDPFGRTVVRRTERALVDEYRRMLDGAIERLTPETHALVVRVAELPDMVRGYERIKLDNVERYRTEAKRLLSELETAGAGTPAP